MELLRISYGCFESGIHGQNIEPFKTFASNSRMTQELQEVTTDYKIQSIMPVQALTENERFHRSLSSYHLIIKKVSQATIVEWLSHLACRWFRSHMYRKWLAVPQSCRLSA